MTEKVTPVFAEAAINVWEAPEGQDSPKWVAKYGDGTIFPIHFHGDTREGVVEHAERFRRELIEKEEKTKTRIATNLEKARTSRGKKKKVVPPTAKTSGPVTGPLKRPRGRRPKIPSDS